MDSPLLWLCDGEFWEKKVQNSAFYKVKLSRIVAIYSLNVADYNGFGCLWQFKGRKRVAKWLNLGLSQEYVKIAFNPVIMTEITFENNMKMQFLYKLSGSFDVSGDFEWCKELWQKLLTVLNGVINFWGI